MNRLMSPPLLPTAPLPPAAHWPQPQFKGTSDLTGNRKPWERDGTDKALSCFREKSTSSPTRTHMSARLCAAQALLETYDSDGNQLIRSAVLFEDAAQRALAWD